MVWLVGLLSVFAACSSGDPGVADGPPAVGDPIAERIGAEPSAFQLLILHDDIVTAAEYEQAVLANIACLEQSGLEVLGPERRQETNELEFTIRTRTAPGLSTEEEAKAVARWDEAIRYCWIEYEAFVADKWNSQSVPNPDERRVLVESLVVCIRATGAEVSNNPSFDTIGELVILEGERAGEEGVTPIAQCVESHIRLFMIPTTQE